MTSFLPFKVALSAVDAVVPGGGAFVDYTVNAFRQGWERRQSRTYRAALATSGMSAEELQAAMVRDSRAQPLITRALLHAAMIDDGPLLDALGAAWGRAVADPTKLDDAERLVLGIGSIRPEDVQVLKLMADRAIHAGAIDTPSSEAGGDNSAHQLAAQSGLSIDSVFGSLIRLSNANFVDAYHGVYGGGSSYRVSRLGHLLRDVLEALQDAD